MDSPVRYRRLIQQRVCFAFRLLLWVGVILPGGPLLAEDIKAPAIVSREAWGALPPKTEMMQEQKPSQIIIHHTGERQQPKVSLETKMRGLQGFAMNPGRVGILVKSAWGDVPYHYYIDFAGKIAEGRDVAFEGDATTSFENGDRIQIALEGDFEREQPTKEQLGSLMDLVRWIALSFAISGENIAGHGDFDQTNCPGHNFKPFLEELRNAVNGVAVTAAK